MEPGDMSGNLLWLEVNATRWNGPVLWLVSHELLQIYISACTKTYFKLGCFE